MREFEVRVAGSALALRAHGETELDAVESVSSFLADGDELTVYPSATVPVGMDGDDPEDPE